jgi:hypothetical protein
VVNPRVQMTQQLEALRGPSGGEAGGRGFLSLFARVGSALREAPESRLQGVRYGEGKLELMLLLPDLQHLDAVKQRIERSGGVVSVLSVNREGEVTAARLKVEAP